MIRHRIALLALGCLLALSQAAAEPAAKVTYIANEGFLVEAGGKRIVVDGLFYGETINWCDAPTAAMREQMESAAGPFRDVDLVLVTHRHVDHFNPEVVAKHLAANKDGVVVGPPQVIAELRGAPGWTERLEEQVREVNLELFGSKRLTIRGIDLQAHRIRHGAYMEPDPETGGKRNRHEAVENLAYLVRMPGVGFIHFGDAFLRESAEYFDGKRFPKQEIDLVFMEGWSEESLAIVKKWMSPGKVIFMHMPAERERAERIAGHVQSLLPNAVVFREPMESRRFPTRGGIAMKRMTPILFVDRIEPSIPFWVDRLGFVKEMEVPEGDHLAFASFKKDGIEVMYQTWSALEKDLPDVARSVKDPSTFLYVEVEDLDLVKMALGSLPEGTKIVLSERKTFYGAREIVVKEPGGHYVTFAQFEQQPK